LDWLCSPPAGSLLSSPTHLIAMTVVTLAFALSAPFSKGNLSPGVREDRGNRYEAYRARTWRLLQGVY